MKFFLATFSFLLLLSQIAADFKTDFQNAMQPLIKVKNAVEKLAVQGKISESNKILYDVFPEEKRTPVEAFAIANMIFKPDHKMSYKLHKQAAEAFPNEAHVQYEWALEQHRAGEYAGAAESYAVFSKANPNYAPVLGLTAECLLRAGKTKEAMKAWNDSERGHGSLETLESLVCEVHTHKMQDADREAYLVKAQSGDIDAAEKLIVLDCKFEHDWWNTEVRDDYLTVDLPLLKKVDFKDKDRAREIIFTGEAALAAKEDPVVLKMRLNKNKFVFDANNTLPKSAALLPLLMGYLQSTGLNKTIKAEVTDRWMIDLRERAQKSKDPQLYNIVANHYLESDKLFDVQKEGWEQTGDERFAVSYIVALYAKKELKTDHADLAKTLKQHPENAFLQGIYLELASKEGKPLEEPIIAAIKAEYSHFSLQPPWNQRIGAGNLRRYWAKLDKVLAEKK